MYLEVVAAQVVHMTSVVALLRTMATVYATVTVSAGEDPSLLVLSNRSNWDVIGLSCSLRCGVALCFSCRHHVWEPDAKAPKRFQPLPSNASGQEDESRERGGHGGSGFKLVKHV